MPISSSIQRSNQNDLEIDSKTNNNLKANVYNNSINKIIAVALIALSFAMIGVGIAAAVGTLGIGLPCAISLIVGGVALLAITGITYNRY